MTDHIIVTKQDGICQIKMNRPDKKNAITIAMYNTMASALVEADNDPDVRAIVISTTGSDFSSGNDLQDFLQHPDLDEKAGPVQFIMQIAKQKKPLIGAVEGLAVGVGATMLLHCDLVFAGENATLSFPFVNMALVPEAGSSMLLAQTIGHQRAAEYLMLGTPMPAPKAEKFGLVNHLCDDGEAEETAVAIAERFTQLPPNSLLQTKALMKSGTLDLEERMIEELKVFSQCLKGAEVKEAINAFMEKRAPDFSKC